MRRLIRALAGALAIAACAAACDTGFSDSTAFGGGGGFFGATDAGAAPRTVPPGPCETVSRGSQCLSQTTAECEDKQLANPRCNRVLACADGVYDTKLPRHDACATSCPIAFGDAGPGACVIPNAGTLICEYPEGTCGCVPVGSDAGAGDGGAGDGGDAEAGAGDAGDDAEAAVTYEWRCVTPIAGCPRTRPASGAPCVRPITCDYGSCLFPDGVRMECSAGQWIVNDACGGG